MGKLRKGNELRTEIIKIFSFSLICSYLRQLCCFDPMSYNFLLFHLSKYLNWHSNYCWHDYLHSYFEDLIPSKSCLYCSCLSKISPFIATFAEISLNFLSHFFIFPSLESLLFFLPFRTSCFYFSTSFPS